MADTRGTVPPSIDQVSTLDVGPSPTPPTPPLGVGATPAAAPASPTRTNVSPLGQGPNPTAPGASAVNPNPKGDATDPINGVGTEGELDVWESHYSMRNFLGRVIAWSLLSVAWAVLAIYTWGYDHDGLVVPTVIAGIVVALLWVSLGLRMAQAMLSHKYRLTTRRLFVSTGFLRRETDQLELLRVQDVFIPPQTLSQRLMNVGSVTVVSSEKSLPNYLILGVADPKGVMDLVWHHARAEQDQRNVRVEQI